MEDELSTISTKELVEIIHGHRFKYRWLSLGDILAQLVRRALTLLEAVELAQSESSASCQHVEDENAEDELANAEAELETLYDSRCCAFLVGLLSSKAASSKVLAGAAYLMAIMTVGQGSHAEGWRAQMLSSCGIVRLVALLSADSMAVRFNALLVLVNFLRHSSASHAEVLRLGAIRKFAVVFGDAKEEPQQNLCVDAFSLLCASELKAIRSELIRSGCVAKVVMWLSDACSTRVATKALNACVGLLEREPCIRAAMLQQQAVGPMMAFVQITKNDVLRATALEALAAYCGDESAGSQHREQVRSQDNLSVLCSILDSTCDREVLLQVLRVLAICAAMERSVRSALLELGCGRLLQRLLSQAQRCTSAPPLAWEEDGIFPLPEEHQAVARAILQMCGGKRGLLAECRADNASSPVKAGGRVAARVGAD